MRRPRAFLFDVFGTLVDWRGSITRELARAFQNEGIDADAHEIAVAWRAEYDPAMAPIREGRRAYTNLDVLHRENLDAVLDRAGLGAIFSDTQRDDLSRAWERLDPWPDTVDGLNAMRCHGLVAPCSNGSIKLMASLARHANLQWDCILGAEIASNYKPHPDTYLKSCAALQLPPADVMMVAAHNDDLVAAREAGLMTAFFPRPLEHPEPRDTTPTRSWDVVADDLKDLANRLAT